MTLDFIKQIPLFDAPNVSPALLVTAANTCLVPDIFAPAKPIIASILLPAESNNAALGDVGAKS